MQILEIISLLLALGVGSGREPAKSTAMYALPTDLVGPAMAIEAACRDVGPMASPMVGRACWAASIAVWGVETAGTFSLYPGARGGCGPMQVQQPKGGFYNTRIGRVYAPPCETLRIPSLGFIWGVEVLRWKLHKVKTIKRAFGAYGPPKRLDSYTSRAMRYYRRAMGM